MVATLKNIGSATTLCSITYTLLTTLVVVDKKVEINQLLTIYQSVYIDGSRSVPMLSLV